MNFSGLWINKQTGEIIKLSGPHGSDDYILEYGHDGNDFKLTETVPIYHSDDKHALLAHSEKFGRRDIFKINSERFQIGDEVFEKYKQRDK